MKKIDEIGIPSYMFCHEFGDIFNYFFENLGVRVIASPPTDMNMYIAGKKLVIDEFCFPVKIMCGHVLHLTKMKADTVFIPIIIGNDGGNSYLCHNLVRMYDIIRNLGIAEADSIVTALFRYDDFGTLIDDGFYSLGEKLGFSDAEIKHALGKARGEAFNSENEITPGMPTIGITGRSYLVHDNWASMELKKKLRNHNCNVITGLDLAYKEKPPITGSHFSLTEKVMFEIVEMDSSDNIDGIIFLLSFNCGPDSGIELAARAAGISKPLMTIVIDELAGDAGLVTRIEAFLDLIHRRGSLYREGV